jgi:hypothetical protein
VDPFFYGVFVFNFEPFVKKVVVHLSLHSDAFVAFFGRLCFPLFSHSNRTYIYLRFKKVSGDLPLIIYYLSTVKYGRRHGLLPRKGYKCITVTEKLHEDIKKRANETNRTMKEYVEYLMAHEKTFKAEK